jgi:hypothetical protein
MLQQRRVLNSYTVVRNTFIEVEHADQIYDDATNQILASTPHRCTYAPGDDVSTLEAEIQQIAAIVWTPEVIAAYQQN